MSSIINNIILQLCKISPQYYKLLNNNGCYLNCTTSPSTNSYGDNTTLNCVTIFLLIYDGFSTNLKYNYIFLVIMSYLVFNMFWSLNNRLL